MEETRTNCEILRDELIAHNATMISNVDRFYKYILNNKIFILEDFGKHGVEVYRPLTWQTMEEIKDFFARVA